MQWYRGQFSEHFQQSPAKWASPISSTATLLCSQWSAANYSKSITKNITRPMSTISTPPSNNSMVPVTYIQTPNPTSTTTKWPHSAKPSSSTLEDTSTTPSTGRISPPSAREEDSTLLRSPLSPRRSSVSSVHMKILLTRWPKGQSPSRAQDGAGSATTTPPMPFESSNCPIRRCWLPSVSLLS